METLELKVTGMTCGGCESAVRRVVSSIAGVGSVDASHRAERVIVTYDPAKADAAQITGAIETAGYRVASHEDPR